MRTCAQRCLRLPAWTLLEPSSKRCRSGGSSQRWLQRQRRDSYARGDHRSRAYHKLEQLDSKHRLFSQQRLDGVVIDLGAAPGGWAEYVARKQWQQRQRQQQQQQQQQQRDDELVDVEHDGRVVAVDLLPMEPLRGVVAVQGDFRKEGVRSEVAAAARGMPVRWVLSDMAPNTSGDGPTDHFRSLDLCMMALEFASGSGAGGGGGGATLLSRGGGFLCKLFRGRDDRELLEAAMSSGFSKARWVKPPASRSESTEVFFLATGFQLNEHC